MPRLTTINNTEVPLIGLGTYPLQGKKLMEIVLEAFKVGYRLIDTSDDYRGEHGIGMALSKAFSSGLVSRDEVFIQTKISADSSYNDEPLAGMYFSNNSPFAGRYDVEDIVREKVDNSLQEMGLEFLDSVLIHLPYPDFKEQIWFVLNKLKDEGKIRMIGVSNFHERHILDVERHGSCPDINEIYISPLNIKADDIAYDQRRGIITMAYSPLIDLAHNKIDLKVFARLKEKYNKNEAQIILRWNIDRGCIPLPKTSNQSRLKENFDIFDFSLTPEEINLISSLHRNYQYLVESKICPGL